MVSFSVLLVAATYTQGVICCVTDQFQNVEMEDEQHKFSLFKYGRVAPILASYLVISMSVWWCIRVQMFFNDLCATNVFLKHGFPPGSLRLVLVLYSSSSYR